MRMIAIGGDEMSDTGRTDASARKKASTTYRVVWKGPVRRASGTGIASRQYVKALRRQGVRTVAEDRQARTRPLRKANNVLIYHYAPHTLNFSKARKVFDRIIINTVWETSRIPRRWVGPLNKADAVLVPTRHNKRAMLDSGVKSPIYIVPHGVNARYFSPRGKRRSPFTFVSVFGFQHRKNPEALLRAYWEEFSPADRVRLIIKTNGYARHENRKWIESRIKAYKARLALSKNTAPVKLLTGRLSRQAVRRLYAKGHVFVLPTRGEGVGLPFLEAMASGIPVIATGWGGQMDFLHPRNSYLVRYRLQTPITSMNSRSSISRQFRSLFAEKGQLWAEPDLLSLRKEMRKAYANRRLCERKGRKARRDSLRLSWDRSGKALKRAVEQTLIRGRRNGRG